MADVPASQTLASESKTVPGIDGTAVSDQGSLIYPFDGRPGDGEVMEMRPGVLWLRMPVPIPGLDYINLWLIEETEGWTLIDTGFKSSRLQKIWDQVVEQHLKAKPITRILCTHFHPDHLGLAGWLQQKFDAELWRTFGEWSFGRMLDLEQMPDVPADVIAFYQRLGFDAAQIEALLARRDATALLATISVPTLLLCGRDDGWSPPSRHEFMHACIPGSRLEVIDECGHMSTMEQSEHVNRALQAWLDTAG